MNIKTGKMKEITEEALKQMKRWPGMMADYEVLSGSLPKVDPIPVIPVAKSEVTESEPVMASDSIDFVDIDSPVLDSEQEIEVEEEGVVSDFPKKRGRKKKN